MEFTATNAMDSFYRLKTSQPEVQFEYCSQYDTGTLFWETVKSAKGAVTHLPNEGSVSISHSDGTINEYCYRQTKNYFRYTPGVSLTIFNSVVFGETPVGCDKRVGYYDANNGIYLENRDGKLGIVKRSKVTGSVVNTRVEYKDWNVMPKNFIGSKIMNPTKAVIFFISLQWLGAGTIQCGFIIDGKPIIAHVFHHANLSDTSYMTTANLPCRVELFNTAASKAASFRHIGTAVITEGGCASLEKLAIPLSASNGVSGITVTTRRPVLSIQPSTTFNSIANRSNLIPYSIDIVTVDQNVLCEVVYSPTSITNASFGTVGAISAMDKDVAGDAIVGGTVIASFPVFTTGLNSHYEKVGKSILSKLPLSLNVAGDTPIALSIVCTAFTGTAVVYANVNWLEFR